jgi:hypothetical protein
MKTNISLSFFILVLISGIDCKIVNSADVDKSMSTLARKRTELQQSASTKANTGYLTCKVDGIPLQAACPGAIMLYIPAKKENNIWGKTPTGIISITINNVETTGTYTIKGNSKNSAGIMSNSSMFEVKKSGTPFTVTIESIEEIAAVHTSDAKAIRGTFQGKLMDQKGKMVEISEGKYSTQ